VEELVDEEVELEVEVDELVEDEDDVDDEVLVDTLPELVEVELDVETLPELVETLPELVEVEVDTLPELVDDELPPPLVLELVDPPEELVDPPEVLVDPVLVEVITTLPPDEPPPPPKKPPKNPPPKPPPPPPITTAPPPPPVWEGRGGSIGRAAMAMAGAGSQVVVVRVITRRMRLTWRGGAIRRAWCGAARLACGAATLACLTYCGFEVFGASATCTAPPPISAPPAAVAASFTRAVRTDINLSLVRGRWSMPPRGESRRQSTAPPWRSAERWPYDNRVNRVWRGEIADSCPAAGQRGQPVPQWHRTGRCR